ncbi:MAG: PaREP1 family protein [Candidatus Bathyarchaeia archaeon]
MKGLGERVERYLGLAHKYLKESEGFIGKGDYVQASEKLWGAAAEMVKVVAAKRGVELKTHGDLWRFVASLHSELKDPELSKLFLQANYLHQNFYEGILPAEAVIAGGEAVKQFINKLEKLL